MPQPNPKSALDAVRIARAEAASPFDAPQTPPRRPVAAPPAPEPARPAPTPPAAPPTARAPYYRVTAARAAMWRGQLVRLAVGDLLSDESYGPDAVARLREAGVALEPAEPPPV